MSSPTNKDGSISFSSKPAGGARKVALAGSFTNWEPVTMRKQKDGSYRITVALPQGAHEFNFVVDGEWATNPFGSLNSLADGPEPQKERN